MNKVQQRQIVLIFVLTCQIVSVQTGLSAGRVTGKILPYSTDLPLCGSSLHDEKLTILFFGNSLSAGYGLVPEQAFPALIKVKIDSLGWPFKVINAGLTGDTSAGGLRRIKWLLRQDIDVIVLELGGNDGLRGIPLEETKRNLQGIIDLTREQNPSVRILIAGMQIPPNMGERYASAFKQLYVELADENKVDLIPFLLEGVGGVRKLNLPDRIHPNADGHKIVAANVWSELKPILMKMLPE